MHAEIIRDGEHGWMHVRFTNDTNQPQFLAKPRALLGEEPDGGFLQIQPSGNYRGRIVKRLPYVAEELLKVEPGESVNSDKFHVEAWYRFPTTKELLVRYHASHPLDGMSQVNGPLTLVESEPVEVDASTSLV